MADQRPIKSRAKMTTDELIDLILGDDNLLEALMGVVEDVPGTAAAAHEAAIGPDPNEQRPFQFSDANVAEGLGVGDPNAGRNFFRPGGGNVHFTGGNVFPLSSTDRFTLRARAAAKAINNIQRSLEERNKKKQGTP